VGKDPAVLWERYVQLAQIEAAFKTMKSELGIRPLYHELGHRVEAHILVAFLAYCLLVPLKKSAATSGSGTDSQSRSGKAFHHSDARGLVTRN
jgi:transposase